MQGTDIFYRVKARSVGAQPEVGHFRSVHTNLRVTPGRYE